MTRSDDPVSAGAEFALARARLATIYDQAALGIAEGALDGRLLRVNARFCEIVGRTETEVLDRRFGAFTHPDDRRDEAISLSGLARSGRRSDSREKRYLRPDGSVVQVVITTSRVEPDDGATPFFMSILQDITAQRAAEREAEESRTRLARYAGTLTTAIEAERSRIARELHDALGQALTSLKMDLGWIGRRLPRDIDETTGAPVTARIAGMQAFIDDTVVLVRRLASELRPAILDSLGLSAALRAHAGEFTDHTDIPCDCHVQDVVLAPLTATALYRIALEACTNVARHARASRVSVRLHAEGDQAVLEVRDDGVGFDVDDAARRGIGLLGITERAALAGGRAVIESRPGAGTCVTAFVPLAAPDAGPPEDLAP